MATSLCGVIKNFRFQGYIAYETWIANDVESGHISPRLYSFLSSKISLVCPRSPVSEVDPSHSPAETRMKMSTTRIPSMQKAIIQPDAMSTDVKLITDHPIPNIHKANGEHLVQVRTTAITNGELLWPKFFPPPDDGTGNARLLIPCDDVAGVVVEGPGSSPFQPGTEVYARSNYMRPGNAREYTVLLTEEMAERPKNLGWAESAAVPMSAETAWQALFEQAGLAPPPALSGTGIKILVTAASGGVGVWVSVQRLRFFLRCVLTSRSRCADGAASKTGRRNRHCHMRARER
jgi:hypothetical protein